MPPATAHPYLLPRLSVLFFLHAFAPGLWLVSLGNVLKQAGWEDIVPWAYALGPLAAMVSPLIVGALADRKMEAQRLLRWLCVGSGICLALGFTAIGEGWGRGWFLFWHGLHSLFFSPSWALVATIVFAHVPHPERQFPLVRVWATVAWVVAGVLVSHVLVADTTPSGGLWAAATQFLVAGFTFFVPHTPPPAAGRAGGRGWRSALGLDAVDVFRTGDFRVFLITTGLLALPLAAFFPYAPQQMKEMGEPHPTAWMTLGQVVETVSMLALGWFVARWRLKHVLAIGLGFAVLRYAFLASGAVSGGLWWIYSGVAMHGMIYTFYFVTAQIFLEMRVDPMMRARAQALLTTVSGGIGSLVGTLACGWWHGVCMAAHADMAVRWAWFWGVLAACAAVAGGYFLACYRGRAAG